MKRLRLRRGGRGYTLVEVAMSMTLFGIGAAALLAMQTATVQGDADARMQDVATQISDMWCDRLQDDTLKWNMPNQTNPTAADNRTTATRYLTTTYTNSDQTCIGDAGATSYHFKVPVQPTGLTTNDGTSYAFDIFGHDVSTTGTLDSSVAFCVQISECIEAYDSLSTSPVADLIQATVRVAWPRRLSNSVGAPSDWCTDTKLADLDGTTGGDEFHAISRTILLKRKWQ